MKPSDTTEPTTLEVALQTPKLPASRAGQALPPTEHVEKERTRGAEA